MTHFCEQLTRFFTGRPAVATDQDAPPVSENRTASRTRGETARPMRLSYPGDRAHHIRALRATTGPRHRMQGIDDNRQQVRAPLESQFALDILNQDLANLYRHNTRAQRVNHRPQASRNVALQGLLTDIFEAANLSPENNTEASQALNVIKKLHPSSEEEAALVQSRLRGFRDAIFNTPEHVLTFMSEKDMIPDECPLTFEPITVPLQMRYEADGHEISTIYSLPTALISWVQTGCDPTTSCPVAPSELKLIITPHETAAHETDPDQDQQDFTVSNIQ